MPKVDEMSQEVWDVIMFATRRQDAPSQLRIFRSYGAQYRYLPGEPLDSNEVVVKE